MDFQRLTGKRVPLPPGHVRVKLAPELWQPYKRLHSRYQAYLSGIPMLAERDFDGKRTVKMTPKQLEALNAAFERVASEEREPPATVFEAQEEGRTRLFKRLQFLS
jgi:hypothetical protein